MTEPDVNTDAFALLSQAAWPVLLVDNGGLVRRANPAATRFFGPEVSNGATALSSLLADGNESAASRLLVDAVRPTPVGQTLKFRSTEGLLVPFLAQVSPWGAGNETRFVMQLLNPGSASGGAKEPSVDASLAHKQKLDCALQLARTVTMDFNNALTTILGYTSLVLAKTEPEHPWRNSLVEIEKAAEKAAEISHQLGSFTLGEKGQGGQTPANLNTVVRRVIDLFRQAAGARIEWTIELEERLYSARFDETKVQQAFIKIVENALEAAGQHGHISVYSRNLDTAEPFRDGMVQLEPGCYVVVDILDDGPGIAPEVLSRVFEPFFTTKPGHRGLGLTWVYGIITNHRGGVNVSSQPRQGACVRIYLPADRRVVKERPGGAAELGGSQTILMVDDEESLLVLGQAILSTYGYRVLTASNGPAALELLALHRGQINLVITDLVMPQMSGRELMEMIRALDPELPVLCASGYVRPRVEQQECYLAKPFTAQELLWRVKQMLEDTK